MQSQNGRRDLRSGALYTSPFLVSNVRHGGDYRRGMDTALDRLGSERGNGRCSRLIMPTGALTKLHRACGSHRTCAEEWGRSLEVTDNIFPWPSSSRHFLWRLIDRWIGVYVLMALREGPEGRAGETVRVAHPSGWAEDITIDEIHNVYGMTLDEYLFFVATEPDGAAARNARRRARRDEVAAKLAKPVLEHGVSSETPLAKYELVTGRDPASTAEGASRAKAKPSRHVVPTPIGEGLSEEERRERRLQEMLWPRGVYPGVLRKGSQGTKTSFPVPVPKKPTTHKRKAGKRVSFAESLVAGIPVASSPGERRDYWSTKLLIAYFRLFGRKWNCWNVLIPWMSEGELVEEAERHGCSDVWDWIALADRLARNGLHWRVDEVETLVSWYPERQYGHDVQRVFVGDKSFGEIVRAAEALGLPTRDEIDVMARKAIDL